MYSIKDFFNKISGGLRNIEPEYNPKAWDRLNSQLHPPATGFDLKSSLKNTSFLTYLGIISVSTLLLLLYLFNSDNEKQEAKNKEIKTLFSQSESVNQSQFFNLWFDINEGQTEIKITNNKSESGVKNIKREKGIISNDLEVNRYDLDEVASSIKSTFNNIKKTLHANSRKAKQLNYAKYQNNVIQSDQIFDKSDDLENKMYDNSQDANNKIPINVKNKYPDKIESAFKIADVNWWNTSKTNQKPVLKVYTSHLPIVNDSVYYKEKKGLPGDFYLSLMPAYYLQLNEGKSLLQTLKGLGLSYRSENIFKGINIVSGITYNRVLMQTIKNYKNFVRNTSTPYDISDVRQLEIQYLEVPMAFSYDFSEKTKFPLRLEAGVSNLYLLKEKQLFNRNLNGSFVHAFEQTYSENKIEMAALASIQLGIKYSPFKSLDTEFNIQYQHSLKKIGVYGTQFRSFGFSVLLKKKSHVSQK